MTKRVSIENIDASNFRVVVQVWDKGSPEGSPDVLAKEIELPNRHRYAEYLTSSRYIVVKELAPK